MPRSISSIQFCVSIKAQILLERITTQIKHGLQKLFPPDHQSRRKSAEPACPCLISDWAGSAQPDLLKARHGVGPGFAWLLLDGLAHGPPRNGFGHLLEDLTHVILSHSNI